MEQWKDIKGYEGKYQVSTYGQVKRLGNDATRKEMMLKQCTNELGYQVVGLSKENKQKNFRVHQLVAKAFIPNTLNENEVNHIDSDKTNNHVSNLEWSNRSKNMLHAFANGHSRLKLTNEQAKEIYKLAHEGNCTQREIARMYGCSASQVNFIKNGKSRTSAIG